MANYVLSVLILVLLPLKLLANPTALSPVDKLAVPKLEFLKNYSGKNQIKILNNRFRIDYEVEEVMLLFFRKHGSAPVVLVKPDGSKIYPRDADAKTIEWHADVTFDLIRLKNPMPGPWQAVGRILADSKVMVLSDVQLQADPLPTPVYQFEQIKAKARIVNADEMIKEGNFREVVRLRASLYPDTDSEAPNFGADIFQLGEFLDNGRELDERPRDGVFTIEYNMTLAYGQWTPRFQIKAALFDRELEQEPITILPMPIEYKLTEAKGEERYHYVDIEVNDEHLDNTSLVFEGTIRFPNNETQSFNLAESQLRQLEIFHSDFGTYKIDMTVLGNMKDGREFKILVNTYEFLTVEPEVVIEEAPVEVVPQEVIEEVEPEPEFPTLIVVLINVVILLFGFLVIWLFVLKRDIPLPSFKFLKKKKPNEEQDAKPEVKAETAKTATNEPVSDDILDLSLPED